MWTWVRETIIRKEDRQATLVLLQTCEGSQETLVVLQTCVVVQMFVVLETITPITSEQAFCRSQISYNLIFQSYFSLLWILMSMESTQDQKVLVDGICSGLRQNEMKGSETLCSVRDSILTSWLCISFPGTSNEIVVGGLALNFNLTTSVVISMSIVWLVLPVHQ